MKEDEIFEKVKKLCFFVGFIIKEKQKKNISKKLEKAY